MANFRLSLGLANLRLATILAISDRFTTSADPPPPPNVSAEPRLPDPLANLTSLSEEMDEAFAKIVRESEDMAITSGSTSYTQGTIDKTFVKIVRRSEDTAIASGSTSHTQGAIISPRDSLIAPWLQGPSLSLNSPSIMDRLLRDSEAREARRRDFGWRLSPMREPEDFRDVRRRLWRPKPSTSGAAVPIRAQNLGPGDQSSDLILATSAGWAGASNQQKKEAVPRRSEPAKRATKLPVSRKPFSSTTPKTVSPIEARQHPTDDSQRRSGGDLYT